jgi:hypothetical protein
MFNWFKHYIWNTHIEVSYDIPLMWTFFVFNVLSENKNKSTLIVHHILKVLITGKNYKLE